MRRKLDQISPPKQSQSAIRHNTDPASNAASNWLIPSQTNGKFEFYLSWKYPCMKQYRKNSVYKTSKESAHCKNTESEKKIMYCALADSVGACLPWDSSSKIIFRVPAGSIWRRNKGEAGRLGVQTSWPFAEKQRFSQRVFYSRYNQTNTALFVSRCLPQLINYAVQFARRGH